MKYKLYYHILKEIFFQAKDTKWIILMTSVIITMVSMMYAVGNNVSVSYSNAVNGGRRYDCIIRGLDEEEFARFGDRLVYGDKIEYFCALTSPVQLQMPDQEFYFSVCSMEGDWSELEGVSLSEGTEPVNEYDIVLDQNVNELFETQYHVGDSIELQYYSAISGESKIQEFHISGFLNAPRYSGYELSGMISTECGKSLCESIYGDSPYTIMLKAKNDTVASIVDLVNLLSVDFDLKDKLELNPEKLDLLANKENNASGLIGIFKYLGAFISIISSAVLYNLIQISMNEKVKKFGLLKSLGLDQGQIVKVFIQCMVLYSFFAMVLALGFYLIFEFAFGKILMHQFADSFENQIDMIWKLDLRAFFISFLLVLCVFVIGYVCLALRIYQLAPLDAVHYNEANAVKIKHYKENDKERRLVAFLGKRNLGRNRSRTLYTGFTLCMMGMLFITVMNVFCNINLFDVKGLKKSNSFDIEFYGDQEKSYVGKECIAQIMDLSAVEDICWGRKSVYEFFQNKDCIMDGNDLVEIRIYSDALLEMICEDNGIAYPKEDIRPMYYLLSGSEEDQSVDTLHLYSKGGVEHDFEIDGVLTEDNYADAHVEGITLILNETAGKEVFGDYGYNLLLIKARDKEECYMQIKELLNNSGYVLYFNDLGEVSQGAKEQLRSIVFIAVYLLICIGFMAVVNMICNININIRLREHEYAVMAALGMEQKDIVKLIIYEIMYVARMALYVAVIGAIAASLQFIMVVNESINYLKLIGMTAMLSVGMYIFIYVFCYCLGNGKYQRNVELILHDE